MKRRRDAIELARDDRELLALVGGEIERRGTSWLRGRPDAAAALQRCGMSPDDAVAAYRGDLADRLADDFFTQFSEEP